MYKNRLKSFAKCRPLSTSQEAQTPPPRKAGIHLEFTQSDTSVTAIPPLQLSWDCSSGPFPAACKPAFMHCSLVLFSTVINVLIKGTGLWFYTRFAPVFTALSCSLWGTPALHSGVVCTSSHLPEAGLQRWRGHSRVS